MTDAFDPFGASEDMVNFTLSKTEVVFSDMAGKATIDAERGSITPKTFYTRRDPNSCTVDGKALPSTFEPRVTSNPLSQFQPLPAQTVNLKILRERVNEGDGDASTSVTHTLPLHTAREEMHLAVSLREDMSCVYDGMSKTPTRCFVGGVVSVSVLVGDGLYLK